LGTVIAMSLEASGINNKIEFNKVCLRYFSDEGETEALRDISFSVAEGEFVSIVGQSGCGKSTLLSLLNGIVKPTSGEVLVDGLSVKGPSHVTAFMLQHDSLFEWRTILGNTVLGPEFRGTLTAETRRRAEALLDSYGLKDFKRHFPQQLSGGMRQRAALARTMCSDPDVLLLDEPFSALDYQTRLSIADEIAEIIRRDNKTAILVTHDIAEAISMADRVVVITNRPGRIKSEHRITFPSMGDARPSPLKAREVSEFKAYFKTIWEELDGHAVD
jgi:NitT/TauT family transport system ATP-binding protein